MAEKRQTTDDAAGATPGFDHFLARISARFVSLTADAVDGEILAALEHIGTFMDVDRVVLSEFTNDGRAAIVRHSWAHPGITPISEGANMARVLPKVLANARQGEVTNIPDTTALTPEFDIDRQEFRRSGARAHLSIPFAVARSRLGVFTVVSIRGPREWPVDQIERLTLCAEVFANALNRRDTERRLRSHRKHRRPKRRPPADPHCVREGRTDGCHRTDSRRNRYG
jgi:GAF domain-containing protein